MFSGRFLKLHPGALFVDGRLCSRFRHANQVTLPTSKRICQHSYGINYMTRQIKERRAPIRKFLHIRENAANGIVCLF